MSVQWFAERPARPGAGGARASGAIGFVVWTVVVVAVTAGAWAQDRPRQPATAGTPGATASAPAKQISKTPRGVAEMLADAREALQRPEKDVAKARGLLLELVGRRRPELEESDLCYALVYLGYLEDRQGDRDAAVKWFEQAAGMEGDELRFIREVAERGLKEPVTWIRHLDEPADSGHTAPPPGAWKKSATRLGAAWIATQQPEELRPDPNLDREHFGGNFDALCQAIDRYYAFFEHKHIDWAQVVERHRPKVAAAASADEFYTALEQLVAELQDAHSWLCNYRAAQPARGWRPGVDIRRVEGEAVVVAAPAAGSDAERAGVRRGTVILEIDGVPVAERVVALRAAGGRYSSERARLDDLYRRLLDGPKKSVVKLSCKMPAGSGTAGASGVIELRRDHSADDEATPPDFPIQRERFVWSGVHPSGYGYIRILSFGGRTEIADEFDQALERLKDTPGLVLDIRDNTGGFGAAHARIVGRFITHEIKGGKQYERSGDRHDAFSSSAIPLRPAGDWQYTRPVALLLNARTGSAADLFAAYLNSTGRPLTVGETTHGNLSGTGIYVVLPCNLVVRISNGYIADGSGRIIEGQGNEPKLAVEPRVADVVAGRDTVLERAIEELRERK